MKYLIPVAVVFFVYLSGAFAEASFNIADWNLSVRHLVAEIGFFSGVLSLSRIVDNDFLSIDNGIDKDYLRYVR